MEMMFKQCSKKDIFLLMGMDRPSHIFRPCKTSPRVNKSGFLRITIGFKGHWKKVNCWQSFKVEILISQQKVHLFKSDHQQQMGMTKDIGKTIVTAELKEKFILFLELQQSFKSTINNNWQKDILTALNSFYPGSQNMIAGKCFLLGLVVSGTFKNHIKLLQ